MSKAGDQVPVMPLVDVVGKADNVAPEQIDATCVNVGVTAEFTTTVCDLTVLTPFVVTVHV